MSLNPSPYATKTSAKNWFEMSVQNTFKTLSKKEIELGNGCGSAGIAVASYSRGPRFVSSH